MENLFSSFETQASTVEITMRLVIPVLLASVIGLNREWVRKPAGLRTHILVALASATFAVISHEMFLDAVDEGGRPDPVRVVEAVVTGVAFLGAGAIIRQSGHVEGITTGASIWLAGAVGVAGGTGHFTVAAITTALGVVTLIVVSWLERRLITPYAPHRRGAGDHAAWGRDEGGEKGFPPFRDD